jgi:hypothetical protein
LKKIVGDCETPVGQKERSKRISRETGHGGVGDVTFFGKKLREQRPWKVKKISFTRSFRVLQLPKNYLKVRGK